MTALRLCVVHFDNLENSVAAAIRETYLCTFVDDKDVPAFRKLADYIRDMPPARLYVGHDSEVYPQFVVTREVAR